MKEVNMVKASILVIILLCLVFPVVSAEIILGQVNSVYNIGDGLNLSINVVPNSNVNGYLQADLICTNRQIQLYRNPMNIAAGQSKQVSLEVKLDTFFIENAEGKCYIKSNFGNESSTTSTFDISKKVNTKFEVRGTSFGPEDEISVVGTAVKENGKALNGFAELISTDLSLLYSGQVINGNFEINFSLPSNAQPGDRTLKVRVYEKSESGEVTNQGESSGSVKIKQIIKSSEVTTSVSSIMPGREITYTVILYDQAGNVVGDDVGIVVYRPDQTVFLEKVVKSGESQTIKTEYNFIPHYWKIYSKTGDVESSKTFYIEEVESAIFALVNGTVVITNTGNVPYTKPVQISIGNESRTISSDGLNLEVGESKNFKLKAPEGTHDVKVNDGNSTLELGSVTGTANVISLSALGDGFSNSYKFWVWLIIILILAGVAYYYYNKVRKKKFFGTTPEVKGDFGEYTKSNNIDVKKVQSVISSSPVKGAGDEGKKEECVVVTLKVKNLAELQQAKNERVSAIIEKFITNAKSAKAKVYDSQDSKIAIFSPSITGNKDNYLTGIRLGKNILSDLEDYNKRFVQKVIFGIGVNSGEMIVEIRAGKTKFTPLGNTVILAKKVADSANQQLWITDTLHRKVLKAIKGEAVPGHATFYKVNEVLDRRQHEEFLKGFVNRQKGY